MEKNISSHAIGLDSPIKNNQVVTSPDGAIATTPNPSVAFKAMNHGLQISSPLGGLASCSALIDQGSIDQSIESFRESNMSKLMITVEGGMRLEEGTQAAGPPRRGTGNECEVAEPGEAEFGDSLRISTDETGAPVGESDGDADPKPTSGGNNVEPTRVGYGTVGATGGALGCGGGSQFFTLGTSTSVLELVSREVIRKLRLAASASSAEDRHVVCEELFADITCALDASAQAALLGPGAAAKAAEAEATGTTAEASIGSDDAHTAAAGASAAVRRTRARGRLYYEVLAVYYASRASADTARALLHLCQLLWDTPWVAPIFALLLHRFLLLPRDTATSPTAAGAAASAAAAATSTSGSAAKALCGISYSDSRVKHLNVLAHGTRQLLLGDVHSGLFRFQPLWAFLTFEVAGLTAQQAPEGSGGDNYFVPPGHLPPVTSVDAVPVTARPWLLAVAAAFLPYYSLDEQVSELARRFPPPLPLEGPGSASAGLGPAGGGASNAGTLTAASLAGLDFLVAEVTDVMGRINSEAGLLKYLRALRALAKSPVLLSSPGPQGISPPELTLEYVAERSMVQHEEPSPAVTPQQQEHTGKSKRRSVIRPASRSDGDGRKSAAATARPSSSPPPPPLAGLPTITKLRLQSELYTLTSGGGPRYAPPEVRRAAFAALDALFPGGRSLRWFVRWASRTLHLEWLEGDGASDDQMARRGWLGWFYWPIHWWTALYGKILLAVFQIIYGIVVLRATQRDAVDLPRVTGTGGAISADSHNVARTRTRGCDGPADQHRSDTSS